MELYFGLLLKLSSMYFALFLCAVLIGGLSATGAVGSFFSAAPSRRQEETRSPPRRYGET